ncbi:MAG TPA: FHA domain-containing protein [Pirellulales bacterium]|nr:FHA domain-containing protein [Pirellulales bacterium]
MATCLETDEDVMDALRESLAPPLAKPSPVPVAPSPVPRNPATPIVAGPPPVRQAPQRPSVAAYRPSLRPPMAVLTVCDDGKNDGEQFRLRDGRFVIGRTEGDLLIPHDGMISSRHVEITRQSVAGQPRWIVTDLQSTNGLFVRISRTLLADQSELLVGKGRYRLLAPSGEGSATADYSPPEGARNMTQAWGADASAPAIPSLVELVGNAFANRVPLIGSEYWIGADPSCAICRANDPYCDARHARLTRDAKGGWQVEQNKTVNGLWFRVPQVVCESVVQFQIGEQRFRLRAGG